MLLPTPPLVAPRRPPSYGGSGLRQGQVIHPPQVSPESDLNSPPQGLRVLTDPARYQYLQTPRPQAWPGPPRVRRQVPTRTPLPPPARPLPHPRPPGHPQARLLSGTSGAGARSPRHTSATRSGTDPLLGTAQYSSPRKAQAPSQSRSPSALPLNDNSGPRPFWPEQAS